MSGKKPITKNTNTENLNAETVQQQIKSLQEPNLYSLITQLIIKNIKKSGNTGQKTEYLSLETLPKQFSINL